MKKNKLIAMLAVISMVASSTAAFATETTTTDMVENGIGGGSELTETVAQNETSEEENIEVVSEMSDGTVATIEGSNKTYTSLTEAINEAEENATVQLLNETEENVVIAQGKSITLNLNGHTLTNAKSGTVSQDGTGNDKIQGTIANFGNLIIVDTSETNSGRITNNENGKGAVIANAASGEVTLKGGTFETTNTKPWYTIKNLGTMTIKDGVTVKNASSENISALIDNGYYDGSNKGEAKEPSLTIDGGSFSGVSTKTNIIKNDDYSNLVINGGVFGGENYVVYNYNVATIKGGTFNYVVETSKVNDTMDKGQLKITGGTFNEEFRAVGGSEVSISGGTFNGTVGADKASNLSISGGTFSSDVKAYLEKGKMTQQTGEGEKYTVTEAVAKVIDTAKTTGATITLDNLHTNKSVDLAEDATYKLVVDTAPQDDVEKIEKYIKGNATGDTNTSRQTFDISVVKIDSQNNETKLDGTGSEIKDQKVTITLGETPDKEGVKVYHVDESGNVSKVTDVNVSGNKITFKAPSFSTYSVSYTVAEEATYHITNNVGVVFSKVDGSNNEYNITLKALDRANEDGAKSVIYRFMSTDLVFKNGCSTVAYEIKPAASMTAEVISEKDNSTEYRFNMDGNSNSYAIGEGITIGTVKFYGYGTLNFSVDGEYSSETTTINIVNTGLRDSGNIDNNIVDTYSTAGEATKKLVINNGIDKTIYSTTVADDESGTITDEIKKETADLTVNIDFPNDVKNNVSTYQDMTVTISGGDLTQNKVIKLGTNSTITGASESAKAEYTAATATDPAKYTISIPEELTKNIAYTVTVEGAGYRTARYTVNMAGAKTLNFWNNVKDNAEVVEVNNNASGKKVTFLAGDIVKDNKINLYDLSAVVSYFGTEGLSVDAHPEYAKYDLNRDGKIDSKDIAYVLVSWGN